MLRLKVSITTLAFGDGAQPNVDVPEFSGRSTAWLALGANIRLISATRAEVAARVDVHFGATRRTGTRRSTPHSGEQCAAKERLHRLIEQLPERELDDAERVLKALRVHGADPLARRLLTAPIDDEPETDDERRASADARDALARQDVIREEDLDPPTRGVT